MQNRASTVAVSIRGPNGEPLDTPALVRLSSFSTSYNVTQGAQGNATAYFQNVSAGDYQVEVSAAGYQKTQDRILVLGFGGTQPVYVYVQPELQTGTVAPAGTIMTPKLQAEVDKGLSAMQKKRYEGALEHFSRAASMAPANPDVLYLRGAAEHALKRLEEARSDYEKTLGIVPGYQPALLALGRLQMESGDNAAAIATLEKAFALNGADWRTHLLLADAYLRGRQPAQAQAHAERAVALTKGKNAAAQQVLDQILLDQIRAISAPEQDARPAVSPVMSGSSRNLGTVVPQRILFSNMVEPPETVALAGQQKKLENAKPIELAAIESLEPLAWAPPETDSVSYEFAPGVACKTAEVLSAAQQRMQQQLKNFEKFTATEDIEHQEIDSRGVPHEAKFKDFSYLVFVRRSPSHLLFLDETRDGSDGVADFPTSLATTGLVGLGVAILTPAYAGDFTFHCEGLSSWRQQAAWQIRFEQKRDVPPRIRTWRKSGALYAIPLKGRLWVAANSYDLLHLVSDLCQPIAKLDLTKDHLVIDYGPITFKHGLEKLWLPWKAEMFMQLHGHRYHHRHTLTHYLLFSVDSQDYVGLPAAMAKTGP